LGDQVIEQSLFAPECRHSCHVSRSNAGRGGAACGGIPRKPEMVGGVSRQVASRPDSHCPSAESRCSHRGSCNPRRKWASHALTSWTISAGAQAVNQCSAHPKSSPQFETSAHKADLSLAWELDFWASRAKIIVSVRSPTNSGTKHLRPRCTASGWAQSAEGSL
jgi:hypothetical protein